MTVIKKQLINSVASEMNMQLSDAAKIVNLIFAQMAKEIESGRTVHLHGFGQFSTKQKDSRPGRNPKTGEAFEVSARRVPHFKCGKSLKLAAREFANRQKTSE